MGQWAAFGLSAVLHLLSGGRIGHHTFERAFLRDLPIFTDNGKRPVNRSSG